MTLMNTTTAPIAARIISKRPRRWRGFIWLSVSLGGSLRVAAYGVLAVVSVRPGTDERGTDERGVDAMCGTEWGCCGAGPDCGGVRGPPSPLPRGRPGAGGGGAAPGWG